MKGPPHVGAASRPIALVIAAQTRVAMPKAAQLHPRAPMSVHSALKKAANSSPAAKAAFQRAAPAVKAAAPHLKALAKQPGKGLLSSLYHGAAALHSLRKVTREMGKETPSALSSAKSAFQQAASSSPAAKAAFTRASPATARAQKHVEALAQLQQQAKPSHVSSLGHGIQALRALRSVTGEMRKAPSSSPLLSPSPLSAASALDDANTSSPRMAHAFKQAAPSITKASTHLDALARNQQQEKPGLLSSLGQGFKAMRALRGVTRELADAPQILAPQASERELSAMRPDRQGPTRRRALSAPEPLSADGVRRDIPGDIE